MSQIGRITWSDPGCCDPKHFHRSVADRRECLSTPRISIYNGAGAFVTLIDHREDIEFLDAIVLAALRQVSEEQRRRRKACVSN